ncbi:hypothetical protein F2P56_004337 [Juglans regia]|uniref:Tobamovirus multiplication protein 2B n=1 Tax=Juglans regia TaxID=51240 RepID=A0A833Y9C0_JUGRE|nr:hypothetical protein F2P56_004337 [Juglans regia]
MATSAKLANHGSSREGSAKASVADQIFQTVQSTSNLLHLMQQSSASQAQLRKLPKNLLAKTSIIKNTGQVLEQMPHVIASLDAHMENGLHRFGCKLPCNYSQAQTIQRNLHAIV